MKGYYVRRACLGSDMYNAWCNEGMEISKSNRWGYMVYHVVGLLCQRRWDSLANSCSYVPSFFKDLEPYYFTDITDTDPDSPSLSPSPTTHSPRTPPQRDCKNTNLFYFGFVSYPHFLIARIRLGIQMPHHLPRSFLPLRYAQLTSSITADKTKLTRLLTAQLNQDH